MGETVQRSDESQIQQTASGDTDVPQALFLRNAPLMRVIAAAFVLSVGLTAVVLYSIFSPPPATQTPGGDWADLDKIVKQQGEQLTQHEQQLAKMQTALVALQQGPDTEALQEKVNGQRLAIAEQQQRMSELQESMSLLVRPGVQQAELAGSEKVPSAQGRLMWDPVTGQMRLLTRGLAALEPGETYQLWFLTDDGEAVSLGVFEVGQANGTTAAYATIVPGVPSNINVAAISIEPTGGSQQAGPSGPIIMVGEAP